MWEKFTSAFGTVNWFSFSNNEAMDNVALFFEAEISLLGWAFKALSFKYLKWFPSLSMLDARTELI